MNTSGSTTILSNAAPLNATAVIRTIPSFLAAFPQLNVFNAFLVSTFMLLFVVLKSQQSSLKGSKQLGRLPPGPVPWPVLGNLPEILSSKPVFRWIHRLMEEMGTEIVCVRLGSTHVVSVSCPKMASEILKKQDAVFTSRPESMAARTFSGGYKSAVLVPHGDQWKKMRRVLTSEIICPARHKWLHEKRVEEADNLVRYVFAQCGASRDINIRTAARHYSGNVIRNMMVSKRYFGKGMPNGGPGIEEEEHVEALFNALGYLYAFCVSNYFPCLEGLDLDGHEKIVKEASETMKKYHDPIVEQRIREWRNSGDNANMELRDLLDVLISLNDPNGQPLLSSDEIKYQTTEIMMVAIDNPSNVAEWTMAEMINQPELLRKAVEELDRVVGKERLVQESDIPHLNYIKACAREAFRLHPIAPFNVPHVAMSDTTIAGYFIPKGSHVLVSRLGLGRNPKVWDAPHRFNPERHLGDGITNVVLTEPDLRFISFSTGRRGCIAASLGTAMTVMLLARLIQGFSWEQPAGSPGIDLSESEHDLFLARPLTVRAEPHLPLHLYTSF
ncbi:hypothetical protein MLD38_031324 [Melastoma candidum]|uniref:Uncharacterized protein n=1 Tax=Melastoma candidum TaxID=119954 RepID=A0ACB9MSV0_9MYRT|nr:hypothetical protein MLD38_031324 [Melastoma candidum]